MNAFCRENGQVLDHYLICEWADGGNLRNFWNSLKSPQPGLVEEVVTQLLDLADALYTLHYSSKFMEGGFVHGDLKPENILRFKPEAGRPGLLGTLKIGDWGLSKEKDCKTAQANNVSVFRASIKYEPPEMSEVLFVGEKVPLKTRSRLYDIWSFGYIMLEFIVWLVEGTQGLADLDTLIGVSGNNQFWEKQYGSHLDVNAQLQVRPSIRRTMDKLDSQVREMPALRELLCFVRDRALVVHLPTHLAALEPGDLEGLEPGDLARLVSGSTELSRVGIEASIDSIKSYDSENPHSETVELVEVEKPLQHIRPIANLESQSAPEEKLTVEVTVPDSAPALTASLKVAEPEKPPRAKATELLKAMRQIMILAAYQAANQPLSATPAGEITATTASAPPSLVFSDNSAATGSVEEVPSVTSVLGPPGIYVDSGYVAASQKDSLTIPDELPKSGSFGVPKPQDVGDDPEWLLPR